MATDIEWTKFPGTIGETWNPINATKLDSGKRGWHCEKVSPGCAHCYAETFNGRNLPACGTGLDYTVPNRKLVQIGIHEDTLDKPLNWKKPRTIFVCSMTDLFAEFVTDEMLDRMFAVMMLCDSTRSRAIRKGVHQFIVLTKRAKRMRTYMNDPETRFRINAEITNIVITGYRPHPRGCDWSECTPWPPENLILGVSVENRDYLHRIEDLRATPAACRMISAEPLLGDLGTINPDGIGWLIAGGESGPGARPMHPDWARTLRDQCMEAGVPYFFKQHGAWMPIFTGIDPSKNDPRCRIHEGFTFPRKDGEKIGQHMWRVGKKAAGNLLDGRQWLEFPQVGGAR